MMGFMLGAYWDPRPASVEECTADAGQFFARLVEVDPLLAHWYEPGRSDKDALKRKVDISDARALRRLVLKGRSRSDIGRKVFENLGFGMRLWNGANEDAEEASAFVAAATTSA